METGDAGRASDRGPCPRFKESGYSTFRPTTAAEPGPTHQRTDPHRHNGLLEYRHNRRVRSAVILLRPEADSPRLTGVYRRRFPGERPYLRFRYLVQRVWLMPPEPLLTGPLPLVALAPISAVTEAELPGIIQRMERRLSGRRGRRLAAQIWGAAYILAGLRYTPALAAQLFRGVLAMKESSTYQAILEEGRAEGLSKGRAEGALTEAKKMLRLVGDAKFGPPDDRTAAVIERLSDLAQLEELAERLPTAGSWQELLGPLGPGRRGGRRRSP
jgi:predicted transposase YdaD